MSVEVNAASPPAPEKKKLIRRLLPDLSQRTRLTVQCLFAALNLWLGIQFFLWVRYFEQGGTGLEVARPSGAEGWLPIAGLMNAKYWLVTGYFPSIHPAALVLFLAFVFISLVFKKAFCSWLCPVGTLSEYLWKLGRRLFSRNLRLPRWADIALRGLKYLLLGFFGFAIIVMPAEGIQDFMSGPFGLMADVRMLNFFRHVGITAALVLLLLVVLSMLVQNFWCRFLCPYGALLGLVSILSPVKIRRDSEACIDCGKCAHACPSSLPVDSLAQMRSAECTACLVCIAVCPAQDALQFALPPRVAATAPERWWNRTVSPRALALSIAFIFFTLVLVARLTGHWNMAVPRQVYLDLVPNA